MQDFIEGIFHKGRTVHAWQDKPVSEALLHQLYGLVKMGPTSANCCPARFVFITSASAKGQLVPLMSPGNREKTRLAPVSVLIGYDRQFPKTLSVLFPHNPKMANFFADSAMCEETAFRNSSLQGGYFILAARGLGLDCGPMSGFDARAVNETFFPDKGIAINFICNLGYGDYRQTKERLPRLSVEQACRFL